MAALILDEKWFVLQLKQLVFGSGLRSTEVAFLLPTQQPRVWNPAQSRFFLSTPQFVNSIEIESLVLQGILQMQLVGTSKTKYYKKTYIWAVHLHPVPVTPSTADIASFLINFWRKEEDLKKALNHQWDSNLCPLSTTGAIATVERSSPHFGDLLKILFYG